MGRTLIFLPITQSGYLNYYFPENHHHPLQRESTKKGSLNYVKMFYQAMILFAGNILPPERHIPFRFLIYVAIYFRATLSLLKRFLLGIYRPLLDGVIIFLGYLFVLPLVGKSEV
jgi:hypothetical protein